MIFKKKKPESGIFDDLPVIQSHPSTQRVAEKKHGRRAMLVPDTPANPNVGWNSFLNPVIVKVSKNLLQLSWKRTIEFKSGGQLQLHLCIWNGVKLLKLILGRIRCYD
ncbi:MAG: hypothetical protein EBT65_02315 [Actinobacteria bacterium]|nr:hypothetical protein [Actinomycetota bacterium]